ncbi:MAG: hypothetical protein WDW38_008571 [Sanguina aurantia]
MPAVERAPGSISTLAVAGASPLGDPQLHHPDWTKPPCGKPCVAHPAVANPVRHTRQWRLRAWVVLPRGSGSLMLTPEHRHQWSSIRAVAAQRRHHLT